MAGAATVAFLLRRIDCNDGVTAHCEVLINGLKARGHRVLLISGPVRGEEVFAERHASLRAAALDWIVFDDFDPARPSIRGLCRMLDALRASEVKVLHPQGLSLLPVCSVLSRLTGAPTIASYHPSVHAEDPNSIAVRRTMQDRLAYRLLLGLFQAQRIIALSTEIADFLREDCWVPQKRIARIPFGVDTGHYRPATPSEYQEARQTLGIADDTLTCVLAGRLSPNKGHDLAVEALRLLRRQRPEARILCLFPGTGAERERIMRHALQDEADGQSFRFLGYVPDLRHVYWASDVVLLPSRLEGFGAVVAEAMCCGCVALRTPSGGARDQIIEGRTGFTVPFNDAAALASRIEALLDADLRAAMRRCAMNHAKEYFQQAAMTEAVASLYDAVTTPRWTREPDRPVVIPKP